MSGMLTLCEPAGEREGALATRRIELVVRRAVSAGF